MFDNKTNLSSGNECLKSIFLCSCSNLVDAFVAITLTQIVIILAKKKILHIKYSVHFVYYQLSIICNYFVILQHAERTKERNFAYVY